MFAKNAILAGASFGLLAIRSGLCAQTLKPPSTIEVMLPGFKVPVSGRWLGPSQNQSGVPLGGMGAGFLELRPDGKFHDTVLQNNWGKPAAPAGCGLTFTATGEKAALLSTVSAPSDALMPTPRYFGHFPMADLNYDRPTSAPISVWLRAFSPFEPQETETSNTPVALFSVRVRNEDSKPHRVTLTFWWDNDIGDGSAREIEAEQREFAQGIIRGVRMGRKGNGGTYALAARADKWFLDVSARNKAGTGLPRAQITATRIISPGDEQRATFAFGWHFAAWKSGDGKPALNRYAARYPDAQAVVEDALTRASELEAAIISWQSRFYARGLPGWMKDGLINGLYLLVRDTIWLDDGRLLSLGENSGGAVTEPFATRLNGSYPLLLLFPEQEKRIMTEFASLQQADGEIPAALGGPLGIQSPIFGVQRPIVSSEFVFLCCRDWSWTQDRKFLNAIYSHAKRALHYAMTMDTDGDGLINDGPGSETGYPSNQYYDRWPWFGTSAYVAGIGLAALKAGVELAKASGDGEFQAWCTERIEKASRTFEEDLWTGSYYRLYTDPDHFRQSDTCLANQLCGQWLAWLCGLGELVPASNAITSLRTIASLNGQPTTFGAISGANPQGGADPAGGFQSADVIPGEVWNFTGTALLAGQKYDNRELKRAGMQAAERAYEAIIQSGTVWNQHFCYSAKDAKPLCGPHNSGNLSLWALPFAFEGVSMRPHAAPQ
jgi:non-lysosomal glucosylceramidase